MLSMSSKLHMKQSVNLFTDPRPLTRKFISAKMLAFVYSDQQGRPPDQAKSDKWQVEMGAELMLLLCWWLISLGLWIC